MKVKTYKIEFLDKTGFFITDDNSDKIVVEFFYDNIYNDKNKQTINRALFKKLLEMSKLYPLAIVKDTTK